VLGVHAEHARESGLLVRVVRPGEGDAQERHAELRAGVVVEHVRRGRLVD
jgi:hypothetical protein